MELEIARFNKGKQHIIIPCKEQEVDIVNKKISGCQVLPLASFFKVGTKLPYGYQAPNWFKHHIWEDMRWRVQKLRTIVRWHLTDILKLHEIQPPWFGVF